MTPSPVVLLANEDPLSGSTAPSHLLQLHSTSPLLMLVHLLLSIPEQPAWLGPRHVQQMRGCVSLRIGPPHHTQPSDRGTPCPLPASSPSTPAGSPGSTSVAVSTPSFVPVSGEREHGPQLQITLPLRTASHPLRLTPEQLACHRIPHPPQTTGWVPRRICLPHPPQLSGPSAGLSSTLPPCAHPVHRHSVSPRLTSSQLLRCKPEQEEWHAPPHPQH